MSMSEFYGEPLPESDAIALIKTAFDKGVNMFDTADVYGYGRNEALIGRAISVLGISREKLVIATKCGILRSETDSTKRGIDNSREYVLEACNKSLERLGDLVGYIDLFYLHRIANSGAQIDEAMHAMATLLDQGKIKAVGLSEASVDVIHTANEALLKYTEGKHQLAAIQTEYSLMSRGPEESGVLSTCRELGITFVAYSPLSRALLTGEIERADQLAEGDFRRTLPRFSEENFSANREIIDAVKTLAQQKGCSTAQIALAWVMSQPGVVPIPGTTKKSHLLSNINASQVALTAEALSMLNKLPHAKGMRYSEAAMRAYGFEDEMGAGK